MQALGSYRKGTMFFVGLGTGLGSALVAQGVVVPMELAHLSYKKGTYEDYLGARGLERLGRKKWQRHVENCMARLISAFHLDDVVLGGGNARKLLKMPKGCRQGDNANAFLGGFRLWETPSAPAPRRRKARPRPLTRRPLPRPARVSDSVPAPGPTPNPSPANQS
jgi:hypothetical protein